MHKTTKALSLSDAEFAIADAPGPDEIVVALGGTCKRAHPRIGNRYLDMEEMAKERDAARR